MFRRWLGIVGFAVGCIFTINVFAQAPAERTSPIDELDPTRQPTPGTVVRPVTPISKLDPSGGGQDGDNAAERPPMPPPLDRAVSTESMSVSEELLRTDAQVRDAFKALLIRKYKREVEIFDERRSVLRWTDGISRVIFVVVHLVLLVGMWAAIREFRHAEKTRKEARSARLKADGEPSEIKIGLEGVALKTSLHGLLILAAALGFYFMYLKFVYPVTVLP